MSRYTRVMMVQKRQDRSKTYLGRKSRRLSVGLEIGGKQRQSGLVRFYLIKKEKKKTKKNQSVFIGHLYSQKLIDDSG